MEKTSKVEGQHSLMGYLPALVVKKICDGELDDKTNTLPHYFSMNSVCLFADISGFTKLSETYSIIGRMGAEVLAFMLNRYMETIITIIGKNGGDIFKFAGDAILVIWPKSGSDKALLCKRAIQCGLEIQEKSKNNIANLSVKIGVGIGDFKIAFMGGQFNRSEYLVIGEGMKQACESETHAAGGGETICSNDVYEFVKEFYEFSPATAGGHGGGGDSNKYWNITSKQGKTRVQTTADAFIMRTKFKNEQLRTKSDILRRFVPAAITLHLDIDQEFWAKELRMITVMFLLLGVDLSHTETKEGMDRVQVIVKTIQRCVYRTMGSLNKFLMDDKGSVMLMCWGLPPISSTEDHLRSVLCGYDLIRELKKLNCSAYIGISTGSAFSGVCGTIGNRKEYSLLGEIVNLSARNMQKAIEIAKKKKEKYSMLICKRTADYISNKMPSFCRVFTKLKGFKDFIPIYQANENLKPSTEYKNSTILSDIKTHLFNISYDSPIDEKCQLLTTPEEEKEFVKEINDIKAEMESFKAPKTKQMIEDSVTMYGREEQLKKCFKEFDNSIKNKLNTYFLINGDYGSGKSLFIRCLMKKYLDEKNLTSQNNNNNNKNKIENIFCSIQMPNTNFDPLNGFRKILKDIYKKLVEVTSPQKFKKEISSNRDKKTLQVDFIGEALFDSECINLIKYIEEILDLENINNHIDLPNNENLSEVFAIEKLKEIDHFFFPRVFDEITEKKICDFFMILIKKYLEILNKENLPLILIVENCNQIDAISIKFMEKICRPKENLTNIIIIASYQEPVIPYMISDSDKFRKSDLYIHNVNNRNTIFMENLNTDNVLIPLIKFYLSKNKIFSQKFIKSLDELKNFKLDNKLKNFLLSKTFNGNPLLIQELLNRIIDKNLISSSVDNKYLLTCEENLLRMIDYRNYSKLELPYRIEKLMGSIIDKIKNTKEIIILKCASVIGNVFDISTLYQINPIKNIMNEDLLEMIYNFENDKILEILYDLEPENLVAKFTLPFFREVLYSRMLSEQKTPIHSEIARNFKTMNFSYMSSEYELKILLDHLIESENTVMNEMEKRKEENKENKNVKKDDAKDPVQLLNMNNLKIFISKKICDQIKAIDMKSEDKNKSYILKESLEKKSDRNITWEERFIIVTKSRFSYWYNEQNFEENRVPLGYFDLKEINTIRVLPDNFFSNKLNTIEIKVNTFYKKNLPKGERTFYFSTKKISKIYEILISLNFLRVKSIYDEFTRQFGIIHLPMNHEIKVSNKTKLKIKINLEKFKTNNNANYNNSYSKFLRKSFKGSISSNNSASFSAKKRNSMNFYQQLNQLNDDNSQALTHLKEDIGFIWVAGFIILIANVQKRITEGPFDSTLVECEFVQEKINLICERESEMRKDKLEKNEESKNSLRGSGFALGENKIILRNRLSNDMQNIDEENSVNSENSVSQDEEDIKKDNNTNDFKKEKQDIESIYNSNSKSNNINNNNNLNEINADNKSENKTKLINDFNNEYLVKSSNERQSGSIIKSGNMPRSLNANNINQYEDGLGKKMVNLDMNNDDFDEIFDMFKDNKAMKK